MGTSDDDIKTPDEIATLALGVAMGSAIEIAEKIEQVGTAQEKEIWGVGSTQSLRPWVGHEDLAKFLKFISTPESRSIKTEPRLRSYHLAMEYALAVCGSNYSKSRAEKRRREGRQISSDSSNILDESKEMVLAANALYYAKMMTNGIGKMYPKNPAAALAKKRHSETRSLIEEAMNYWGQNIDPNLSAQKAATELTKIVPLSHKKLAEVVSKEKKKIGKKS